MAFTHHISFTYHMAFTHPEAGLKHGRGHQCGPGVAETAQSAQAWPMGIFRALPTDSGEGGWIYSGPQNGENTSISPCLLLSTGKAGGPSVKCSGSPLLTWGVQFIVGVVSSGIGGVNLGGVGGILSVVAAKAGLKAMAI